MLWDRIIVGVQDKVLQLKLLDGKDEPLSSVVDTCKVYEAAAANKLYLQHKEEKVVHSFGSKTSLKVVYQKKLVL